MVSDMHLGKNILVMSGNAWPTMEEDRSAHRLRVEI